MHAQILTQLAEIEQQEQVRIVYACESGSRAWGFPSADSDYDVRFLYVHPRDWYLSLFEQRDVIERPLHDSLDIGGWDLKKAGALFAKSNPPLLEWLDSPIVYLERGGIAQALRDLAPVCYSPTSCAYHYLSMAKGNYRDYLQGEAVRAKKYFYVLRPLLAVRWLTQGLGVVPTDFHVLLERLLPSGEVRETVDALLEAKRTGLEKEAGPPIAPLQAFLEAELAHWAATPFQLPHPRPAYDALDAFFRESVTCAWEF